MTSPDLNRARARALAEAELAASDGDWKQLAHVDYRGQIERGLDGSNVLVPSSSRPRPGSSSSLRPDPSGRDEDEDLVPSSSPAHSWSPVDVVAAAANPPAPPEIVGLFYPGANHLVSGESEALKTWLLLAAAVAEIAAGRGVLWVDGDDVGVGAVLERLRLLGAGDEAIGERFLYMRPNEPLGEAALGDVLELVRECALRLAVLDGFNPLLALHGCDPNSGVDVERFYGIFDPIRKLGVAIVIADNVVKSSESRGAWAIGSERKKSKAEVHLGMKTLAPLVRGGTGKAKIDVHKDRPGHLERPSPGVFVIESAAGGCSWRIERDKSRSEGGGFRPTTLMEKVSRFLEPRDPQSRNQIEDGVPGNATYKRRAIDALIEEGYASEFEGAHSARLVRFERPFVDDEFYRGPDPVDQDIPF